ncbi:DUF2946 family protein [Denitrificimonas caeni]|uniref:DUF2946 family protein n=1 Tax=Denitrificimonas caeni TaxID=521720 RepID=UPI003B283A20
MIKQRRNDLMAIWLGLFAMLMIHVGPLISGTQALLVVDPVFVSSATTAVMPHDHSPASLHDTAEHADPTVDYHALMGHQPAPTGTPQWLANLEMCGYCDLLTVSPPLVLTLLLSLPVMPPVLWLAVLPAPPKPLPAAHSLRHPRAPPIRLVA